MRCVTPGRRVPSLCLPFRAVDSESKDGTVLSAGGRGAPAAGVLSEAPKDRVAHASQTHSTCPPPPPCPLRGMVEACVPIQQPSLALLCPATQPSRAPGMGFWTLPSPPPRHPNFHPAAIPARSPPTSWTLTGSVLCPQSQLVASRSPRTAWAPELRPLGLLTAALLSGLGPAADRPGAASTPVRWTGV